MRFLRHKNHLRDLVFDADGVNIAVTDDIKKAALHAELGRAVIFPNGSVHDLNSRFEFLENCVKKIFEIFPGSEIVGDCPPKPYRMPRGWTNRTRKYQ